MKHKLEPSRRNGKTLTYPMLPRDRIIAEIERPTGECNCTSWCGEDPKVRNGEIIWCKPVRDFELPVKIDEARKIDRLVDYCISAGMPAAKSDIAARFIEEICP